VIKNNLKVIYLLISFFIVLIGYQLPTPIDLEYNAKMVLFILAAMVVMWTTKPVPYSLSTLFMITMLEIFNVVETFEQSVAGFSSHLMFFMIGVFMLGKVVSNIGLHKKISSGILSMAGGSYRRILWAISLTIYVLAFFLPSGTARVQILLPVIKSMEISPESKNKFLRSSMIILGIVSPIATVGVLTGGGYPMLAAELMKDYGANFSWIGWIITISPIVFITVMFSSYLIIRQHPKTDPFDRKILEILEVNNTALSFDQKYFLAIFLTIIIFWNLCPLLDISYAIVTFVGLLILSASSEAFIKKEDIVTLNWDELLMLGGALSIGGIVSQTGGANWLVNKVMTPALYYEIPAVLIMGIMFILMIVTRFFFINPSGWLVVIIPLFLGFAQTLGISPVKLGLVITLFSGVSIIPLSTPPSLLVFSLNHYSFKEHIFFVMQIIMIMLILVSIAWFFYWPLLGI